MSSGDKGFSTGFSTTVLKRGFEGFADAMKQSVKQPVAPTQGGSSRKGGGARVAARNADLQKQPPK